MELFVVLSVLGVSFLLWLIWQLLRAKQFTQFKLYLNQEIAPQLAEQLKQELIESRSEITPNNDEHIQATLFYWQQYPIRILQAALDRKILTSDELKNAGKFRFCQHLYHVQSNKLHHYMDKAWLED